MRSKTLKRAAAFATAFLMSAGIAVSEFQNDISFGITVMATDEENSEEIVIDNCFTDANFRNIIKTYDIDDNGIIDNDELSNITSISINGKIDGDVSSFEGIEYLTKLTDVSIFNCSAVSLDLSKNTELCNLWAFNNPKLASLDISGCNALQLINVSHNDLTYLDLSSKPALQTVKFSCNSVSDVKLDGSTAITSFQCDSNRLTKLDLSQCASLNFLICSYNLLTELYYPVNNTYSYIAVSPQGEFTEYTFTGEKELKLGIPEGVVSASNWWEDYSYESMDYKYFNYAYAYAGWYPFIDNVGELTVGQMIDRYSDIEIDFNADGIASEMYAAVRVEVESGATAVLSDYVLLKNGHNVIGASDFLKTFSVIADSDDKVTGIILDLYSYTPTDFSIKAYEKQFNDSAEPYYIECIPSEDIDVKTGEWWVDDSTGRYYTGVSGFGESWSSYEFFLADIADDYSAFLTDIYVSELEGDAYAFLKVITNTDQIIIGDVVKLENGKNTLGGSTSTRGDYDSERINGLSYCGDKGFQVQILIYSEGDPVSFKASNKAAEETDPTPDHEHTYSTTYSYDALNHWHECECGEKSDVEEHTASDWITDMPATPIAEGSKHKECTVCDAFIEEAIIERLEDDSLFDDSISDSASVETDPEADPSDSVTTITIHPAFNLKHKDGEDVELDLTDIKIKAKEIYDDEEKIEKAEECLGIDISPNKHYNLLDLTLWDGNTDISNGYEGIVKVIIPIPVGHLDKEFSVYRLIEKNNEMVKEIIPSVREDNNVIIYLEHFSLYALVGESSHVHCFNTEYSSDATGHWYACSGCDEKVDFDPHTEDSGTVTTEPTETTEGVKTFKCTKCEYVMRTETIPAIVPDHTHEYGTEWKSDRTSHWHECSCGEKADIGQHISDGGVITVQPTPFSAGLRVYSCSVCGYIFRTETIPATGYNNNTIYPTYSFDSSIFYAVSFTEKLNVTAETTGNTVTLKWDKVEKADKYYVYQYKNGKYVKVKTTSDTSVTFKKLKNCETYKFLIRYTKSGRLSPTKYSGTISVKVYYKPITKPTATKNSIKLTWDAVPEAEKYAIYKYVDGKAIKLTETKKLSVKIGKLTPDTEYKYIVRAYVDGKWTTMLKSDIVTVKTKAE